MKKESGNKIRLGVFVTAAVALLIISIFYIGQRQQLFSKTFRISAVFRDVSGLQAGNNIRFSGITVGIVEDVEIINDTSVRVDMILDEKVKKFIKKDARAIIGSDGLMGNKIMNVTPGTSGQKEIENNDMIATNQPINMDEVLSKIKLTTDNAAELSTDLSAIVHNIRSGKGTIGKLFMDSVFATNLDKTVVNVKQGTKAFSQNMEAAKSSILLRGYYKDKNNKSKAATDKEPDKNKEEKK